MKHALPSPIAKSVGMRRLRNVTFVLPHFAQSANADVQSTCCNQEGKEAGMFKTFCPGY